MSTPQDQIRKAMEALGIKAPEGWDALDPTSAATAARHTALERYEKAKIISDGVSDDALRVIASLTIDAEVFKVHELGLLNAIGFGIWRDGQNALVRWIYEQKRVAAQGPGGDIPSPKVKRKR